MAQTVKEVMTKNPVACEASDTAQVKLADISAAPGNR